MLFILCGFPFAGKTTLAMVLVDKYHFVHIDLDEIKFEIFGNETQDEEIDQSGWDKVYQEMYKRIENALKSGKTVVQDAGNFTKNERAVVKRIADKLGIKTKVIFLETPKDLCMQRLIQNRQTHTRFDVTEASFQEVVEEFERPDKSENTLVFNLTTPINSWVEKHFGPARLS